MTPFDTQELTVPEIKVEPESTHSLCKSDNLIYDDTAVDSFQIDDFENSFI